MKDKSRIIIFTILLLGIGLINLFASDSSFSDRENRFLEQIPKFTMKSVMDGKFNTNFDKYASDQFIVRDRWIELKTRIDLFMLKKDNNRIYYGKEDFLFDVDKPINVDRFNKNMININKLHEAIDTPLDIVLVPSKSSIYYENLPYKAPVINEKQLLSDIQCNIDEDINLISPVDSFNHKKDELLYYKTDHHYTTLGAYYTYKDYVESIGIKAYEQKDFKKTVVSEEFLGTLFRKANYYSKETEAIEKYEYKEKNDVHIKLNGIDEAIGLYDESYLNKTDKYSYFLGGDHPLLNITTSNKGGGTVVILKDSFANSMIPFLTLHFERLIVIDERYYNLRIEDYIKTIDYDRILYIFNLRTFYDR